MEKLPKSEVSFNICQMVYAKLQLEKMVDWRTFKTSKKVNIPTTMDIPRASPSNTLQDGLGPKKNISEGVVDEDYSWLVSFGLEDLDEEVIPNSRDGTKDTAMEENLSLVVFEEADI